ncbi:MAG TPA: TatD family hydrolase [Longimicrobium sp.]|nr:TatD family hydrolase [Longimicrobium sp.]
MVEADTPYLAPVPHRGKTNDPFFVVHTAPPRRRDRGVDPADFFAQTLENTHRF